MEKSHLNPSQPIVRYSLIGLIFLLLFGVYLFQRWDYLGTLVRCLGLTIRPSPNVVFAFNRTLRLIINDTLCMGLIYLLFDNRNHLRLAFYIFLIELLALLPLYLVVKLNVEGDSEISSPLLSPLHRMIVNPLLMFILIGAFYYQQFTVRRS